MTCSNCFNGCVDIKSDQCIKYTGNDIPSLDISNGDPLSTIELKLATYLLTALDGTGINLTITDTCALIAGYLDGTTLPDFISALIQATCSLQTQVTAAQSEIDTLNGDYDVDDCLSGVTDSSDTHNVLQAVITKLCAVDDTLTALAATISTNYVALADLDALIASYLATTTSSTNLYSRMIPYTAVPFFAAPSYLSGKFDGTGAGIGTWEKIYLCNGNNGTPDLRGRTLVGATNGMGGGAFSSAVDPAISGNPNYSLNTLHGSNTVTLTNINQIPAHSHTANVVVTDPTHFHYVASNSNNAKIGLTSAYPVRYESDYGPNHAYLLYSVNATANVGKSSSTSTGISVSVTNTSVGGTSSHNNIQPVIGSYFIMYIP